MTDVPERVEAAHEGSSTDRGPVPADTGSSAVDGAGGGWLTSPFVQLVREFVVIVVVALLASALLRAFVMQAFFVPSGSMLPEIQLHDRIVVSRIDDIDRGEVVVFEDPGGWIPAAERAEPPDTLHRALEWIGVLPASGHDHLVKRVVGLPGDRVACCDKNGQLEINGQPVDESDFLLDLREGADNVSFDVVVPEGRIFVLGDNRYVSGDSSRQLPRPKAFVPMDMVVGRAVAVVWPAGNAHILHIPSAYDDVPDGRTPPERALIVKPDRRGDR
jgi:signal peptidase I